MKKSEFEKKRAQFWHDEPDTTTQLVKRDVWAAEAAGVTWDPEEEPLPEELVVTPSGVYIRAEDFYVAVIHPLGTWDSAFADGPQRLQIAREMVRRYNAWPALRAIAKRLEVIDADLHAGMLALIQEDLDKVIDGQ